MSTFTDLAKQAGETLSLPWQWIYSQWAHETGGFTSRLMKEDNNLAGITSLSGGYASYTSYEDFTDSYVKLLKLYQETLASNSLEDFAYNLHSEGYYTDEPENYLAGLKFHYPEGEETEVESSTTKNSIWDKIKSQIKSGPFKITETPETGTPKSVVGFDLNSTTNLKTIFIFIIVVMIFVTIISLLKGGNTSNGTDKEL